MRLSQLTALLGLLTLPACSTLTTGSDHTMTVATEPPGAACELVRQGVVIGAVNPTPGSVRITKSQHDITVNCTRAGHEVGTQVVKADFQAMTLGNVLVGGVIGIGVDLASGAAASLPSAVQVRLPPSQAARAAEVTRINNDANERILAVRRKCPARQRASCDDQVQQIEVERDAAVAALPNT